MSLFPFRQTFSSSESTPPTLLVVVDTEEEFDWHAPFNRDSRSVENIARQHLAQDAFDAHGVVPTYVVDYPVATSPDAVAVLKPWLDRGRCEIGAHLHPWVNPPDEEDVNGFHSFACNLPAGLMRRKLSVLRDAIVASFGRAPVVYKAGRYGVGPETPSVLDELGFHADTSVVPHLDFSPEGGPDFRGLPDKPFLLEDRVAEVPLSVHFVGLAARLGPTLFPVLERAGRFRLAGLAARLGVLERLRLSPEGHELQDMQRQTAAALAQGHRHLMLTYHSSSLLPGGSPYAPTRQARDDLVRRIADYVRYFRTIPGATATTVSALVESLPLLPTSGHSRFASVA